MASAIVGLGALAAGVAVGGAIGSVSGAVIGAVVYWGVNYTGHFLFGIKPPTPEQSILDQRPTLSLANADAAIPVIYGERLVGGTIVHIDTSNYQVTNPTGHTYTREDGLRAILRRVNAIGFTRPDKKGSFV